MKVLKWKGRGVVSCNCIAILTDQEQEGQKVRNISGITVHREACLSTD